MIPAVFIERLNRFSALISVSGRSEKAHVPNSGRLKELFVSESKVLVSSTDKLERKTRFTLKAVKFGDIWVSIDSTIVNDGIGDALRGHRLPMFVDIMKWRREAVYKRSRFDFFITEEDGKGCYLEVKSVTLVKDGVAMFPDAPTERGRKHILELIDALQGSDHLLRPARGCRLLQAL